MTIIPMTGMGKKTVPTYGAMMENGTTSTVAIDLDLCVNCQSRKVIITNFIVMCARSCFKC